jgi:hypothetical protein
VSTDVSEEHVASIFRVEEIISARNQQASRWQAGGVDGFILSDGRANGNRVPVFLLPSVSYINPDFRLADYFACHLLVCWFLAEIISLTLKMEAICSSETSVDTQRTTRRYIP